MKQTRLERWFSRFLMGKQLLESAKRRRKSRQVCRQRIRDIEEEDRREIQSISDLPDPEPEQVAKWLISEFGLSPSNWPEMVNSGAADTWLNLARSVIRFGENFDKIREYRF